MAISQERRARFDLYFDLLDRDGDGALEELDFRIVVDRLAQFKGIPPGSPPYNALLDGWLLTYSHLQAHTPADRKGRSSRDDWAKTLDVTSNDTALYAKYVSPVAEGVFALLDSDQDGKVTPSEFGTFITAFGGTLTRAEQAFGLLDSDKSGTLSRAEVLSIVDEFHRNDSPTARGRYLFGAL